MRSARVETRARAVPGSRDGVLDGVEYRGGQEERRFSNSLDSQTENNRISQHQSSKPPPPPPPPTKALLYEHQHTTSLPIGSPLVFFFLFLFLFFFFFGGGGGGGGRGAVRAENLGRIIKLKVPQFPACAPVKTKRRRACGQASTSPTK